MDPEDSSPQVKPPLLCDLGQVLFPLSLRPLLGGGANSPFLGCWGIEGAVGTWCLTRSRCSVSSAVLLTVECVYLEI